VTVLAIEPEAAAPPAVPPAWAKAAAAKAKRDRQSYAEFRAADQQQHERAYNDRVTAVAARAENELRLWREDVATLEPAAAEALAAFRAAEGRARDAVKFAAGRRAEYERIRGKGSPEEEAGAAVHADAADNVASDAAKVVEEKRAVMDVADQDLAEAREGRAEAERVLEQARKAAGVPAGTAPVSDVTVRACAAYMQADVVWNTLSDADRQRVRMAARPRDVMSNEEALAMIWGTGGTCGGAS
jgi:hypothetical protein